MDPLPTSDPDSTLFDVTFFNFDVRSDLISFNLNFFNLLASSKRGRGTAVDADVEGWSK